jgi:hypothetical protein
VIFICLHTQPLVIKDKVPLIHHNAYPVAPADPSWPHVCPICSPHKNILPDVKYDRRNAALRDASSVIESSKETAFIFR